MDRSLPSTSLTAFSNAWIELTPQPPGVQTYATEFSSPLKILMAVSRWCS